MNELIERAREFRVGYKSWEKCNLIIGEMVVALGQKQAEIERLRLGVTTLTENRDELARENKRLTVELATLRGQ